MLIVRSQVPLRQPEDGQYRPKHVVVHYIVIKHTSRDTTVFDYIQFSKWREIYSLSQEKRNTVCIHLFYETYLKGNRHFIK